RPLVDLGHASVAEVTLDRVLLRVAVSPEHLNGRVGDAVGRLGGHQLRHGRLARRALPLVLQPGSAVGEEARRLDADEHVSELEADRLMLMNGLTERGALCRVVAGGLVSGPSDANRQGSDADATTVK